MKLEEQIHLIKPKNSEKIETIKLSELFNDYNPEIKQIIRFNSKIYSKLLENNSGITNLFNKVNPNVNSELIQNFNNNPEKNNKALITEIQPKIISGVTLPILVESSMKISKIIEMNDIKIEDLIFKKLYKNSINKSSSFEDFKNWFINEFEKGRITQEEFKQINLMFYRKIKLLNK